MPPPWFRAVAIDYDGTLSTESRPAAATLDALAEVRRAGLAVVLVTGRILTELHDDFPEIERHVDAIVAENGAIAWRHDGGARLLAPPVSGALEAALGRDGIAVRRGQVILALDGIYDLVAQRHVGELGLELQLVRNRGALMILPAGVTKASGLHAVLADLGLSPHSTVAIGDAENDHMLLESCELGVAVGNAVPSLRASADLVLPAEDGDGVAGFLRGPLLRDEVRIHPARHHVRLGGFVDGGAATVPGSQINVLVTGGSGGGKSSLAGLLVERLVARDYVVLVIDPEGDHLGLAERHDVLVVGGLHQPPDAGEVERMLEHRLGSVVVDLSLQPPEVKRRCAAELLDALSGMRRRAGIPHWIVVDEAHQLLGPMPWARLPGERGLTGLCLVTFRASDLRREALDGMDVVLTTLDAPDLLDSALAALAHRTPPAPPSAPPPQDVDAARRMGLYQALLVERGAARVFVPDPRTTRHVRHWHKYLAGELPPHLRFWFVDDGRAAAGAANLSQFHHLVERVSDACLLQHLRAGDFSRWVGDVVRDDELAEWLGEVERASQSADPPPSAELRTAVTEAVALRYPEHPRPP